MKIEDIITRLQSWSFNPDDLQEEIYGIIEALEAHQKEDCVPMDALNLVKQTLRQKELELNELKQKLDTFKDWFDTDAIFVNPTPMYEKGYWKAKELGKKKWEELNL